MGHRVGCDPRPRLVPEPAGRGDRGDVQVGGDRFRARPEELAGDARTAMPNDTILARVRGFKRYARKAGRTIPVAVLHPV